MARIAGIDLPRDKRIEIGLTYIYGIGRKSAQDILKLANVDPDIRVKDLTEDQESALREVIDKHYTIEGDLRREVALNIKRLTEIGCYRGVRHRRGLPVRGQRTKTNARTRKGPKKTIAAVFSAIPDLDGIPVLSLFTPADIPGYETYPTGECRMCKAGQRIDALANSYGLSTFR